MSKMNLTIGRFHLCTPFGLYSSVKNNFQSMNIEQIREYTLSLPGVTEDQAFGEDILNFRLEGKIFEIPDIG